MSSSSSPDTRRSRDADPDTFFYLTVATIIICLLLPGFLVGAALWFLLRDKLGKTEGKVLLGAGAVATVFNAGATFSGFLRWLLAVLFGTDGPRLQVFISPPLIPTVTVGVMVLGAALVLSGTRIAAKLGRLNPRRRNDVLDAPSILPTDAQKQKVSIAPPPSIPSIPALPGGGRNDRRQLAAAASAAGGRPIPLGLDRNGVPVAVSESEIRMHGMIFGSTGSGKALALDTPIPTPGGWTTMGELVVGDVVFDEQGRPTRVVFATDVQHDHDCFEVTFSDGETIVADAEHRWVTTTGRDVTAVRTTAELAVSVTTRSGRPRHRLPFTGVVEHPDRTLPDDPYAVGRAAVDAGRHDRAATVDAAYRTAGVAQRFELLRGMVAAGDPDGTARVVTVSEAVRDTAREVAASLTVATTTVEDDGVWTVTLHTPLTVAGRLGTPPRPARRHVVSVVACDPVPVRCIEVDAPSHLYLAGRTYLPTHNTETLKVLTGALLDIGWHGHILDLKEDTKAGGLRDFCYDYAIHHALPYQEIRLSSTRPTYWFNPLADMGPDEIRDTVLALQTFDDGYWQSINKQMLGQLVRLFYYAHEVDPTKFPFPTMYDMSRVLSLGEGMGRSKEVRQMMAIVIAAGIGLTEDDFHTILRPQPDHAKSAAGFGARLSTVYETDAGRYTLRPSPGTSPYDITMPGIGYVGLDSQGRADLSNVVATAFLQRSSVWAAQRTSGAAKNDGQRFLIIDEASVLNRTVVHSILTKARSAGISIMLCSQSPLDFDVGQAEAAGFAALAQNANVMVFMAQGEPEAAERCAEFLGKVEVFQSNLRYERGSMIDEGSVRKDLVYRVQPDDLRRLSIGEAVLRVGKPDERVTWMKVRMRDPRS